AAPPAPGARTARVAPDPALDETCKYHILGYGFGCTPTAGVAYGRLSVPLLPGKGRDGDLPKDVSQGDLGDCYLLAPLASLSNKSPAFIRRMVRDNGDGTFDVTFYRKQSSLEAARAAAASSPPSESYLDEARRVLAAARNPGMTATTMRVRGTVPEDDTGPVYAQADEHSWVAVVEKAYAALHGGSYAVIGDGGDAGDAMTELTGRASADEDADKVTARRLADLDRRGYAVVAMTRHDDDAQVKKDPLFTGKSLIPGHEYWVESVDPRKGTVTLGNPWGWDERHVTLTERQFQTDMLFVFENPVR
ncbi:MAG: hypothetical protein KGL53_00495, partial [Elusimicrobia bacterium]|nr:hypothetical protein [Elusimicrobiota bacterium]